MVAAAEFLRRRRQLMRMTGDGSIIILPSAPIQIRTNDVEHNFRQDSDFFYLSAFTEPESVLVLVPGREHGESLLFCRERDRVREAWDGPRAGPEGAVADFGMDDAFPIGDLDDILPNLIEGRPRIFYTLGRNPTFDAQVMSWVNSVRADTTQGRSPEEFVSLEHALHDMRLYKSRSELGALKRSAKLAVAGHRRAMGATRPGCFEYEVAAEFLYELNRRRCEPSYPPIVGSGPNGCVLHHISNDRRIEDGDLILMDAGAEVDYYASDITRTFPANGRYSGPQRALYDVVLEAQLQAIDEVKPGACSQAAHERAAHCIARGLVDLGIVKGSFEQTLETQAYKPFFMHKSSHWLGLDVHDVGDYQVDGQPRLLEPGMVMTIEPGVYISPNAKGVAKRWRGIGIRIEDDVAITRDGHLVLSQGLPKQPDEVESMVGNAL